MDHCEGVFTSGTANRFWKDDSVFVVYRCEVKRMAFEAVAREECRQSEPFPIEQIVGGRKGDARAVAPEGRVGHHVALKLFDKSDARVFASAAAWMQLVVCFRFECYANTLNANRIALVVELHTRDANARKIALPNEARKKVKLPVRTACGPGV